MISAQFGQNCATATQVEITIPVSEPRYGTKLISPAASPIRTPWLRPISLSVVA